MRIFLLSLLLASLSFSEYKEGEVLVKFKDGVSPASIKSRAENILSIEPIFEITYKIRFSKGKVEDMITSLQSESNVVYAEPNYIRRICATTNDPGSSSQWGLSKIEAPLAWDIGTGTDSIIIAIVDTGVNYNHEDLKGKVIGSWSFVSSEPDPMDKNGHGTHVAGIAGASTNNDKGIAGVAWNCKILAIKGLDSTGSGFDDKLAIAIRYAADNGARVINMSFGDSNYSRTLQDACDSAFGKGCLLVAAAGNYGTNVRFYPAAYDSVLAVGATDSNDRRATFSNYGDWVDVAAPGQGIYSTKINNYDYMSGTSQGAPFVSGLAGLVFSLYPYWTNRYAAETIKASAETIGNQGIGGRINAYKTLTFGEKWAFGIKKPLVFPNPYISSKHKFITFGDPIINERKLTLNANIRIYNIIGELMKELEVLPADLGQKTWKPELSAGVYIYIIKGDDGSKAFGKIGIIR
ncbi:S8 family serine peptidase [bacterium]|nr:S8 family serine peptidase [bacterium]